MKRTDFRKATTWAILAFIVVFTLFLAKESRAESRAEWTATNVELVPGYTYVGGLKRPYRGTGALLTERFNDKYDVGLMLMTSQDGRGTFLDYGSNLGVQVQRVAALGRWEMGIGVAYWKNQTPAWNSNATFSLSAGVHVGRATVRWRHYSTAGSSSNNRGLDMLTIGWRF